MAALAALLYAVPCAAQSDAVVTPSEVQVQLVEKGVAAGLENRHEVAVDYFRAALELGELNIGYLNLGRALSRLGRCEEARDAYQKALLAPPVASPPVDEVRSIIHRYERELAESCSGTLLLRCEPRGMSLSIDGAAPTTCPQAPLTLAWGTHVLEWSTPSGPRSVEVQIEPGRSTELTLAEADRDGVGWVAPVGWTSLGLGLALVGAGLAVDLGVAGATVDELDTALAEDRLERARELADRLETEQATAIGLYLGGTALAAGGLGLLLAHYLGAPADGHASTVTLGEPSTWLARGGAGLAWTMRW